MLEVVLHDYAAWRAHLLPLVYTRPVSDLRVGMLTISQKWKYALSASISFYTIPYLQQKFPSPAATSMYLVIRGNVLPSPALSKALRELPLSSVLTKDGLWIAYKATEWREEPDFSAWREIPYQSAVQQVDFLEDIYRLNEQQLVSDYDLLTANRQSAVLPDSNTLFGERLFIGRNAEINCSILNAMNGPIYIGDGAVVEEGSVLRGPIAICAGARVKMGSRLYPNVTVGPGATIAGEVNNSVLWGNCAKGHEGYLGCAVIGEGCNIGAGSSNSNLLNTWGTIKLYDYATSEMRDTNRRKVGVFMGDYAMCGINASMTTGTVIGVGAQIAMSNIIPKFVPDFSWFTDAKQEVYRVEKFLEMLQERAVVKNEQLSTLDTQILRHVHKLTEVQQKKN
ncbi:putative sugar nucleotidyl transferase [Sphingobacterium griseoflavum]|uniref:Glucose-1-phosphate thymidylyltransferase n=1 Tax=Sphingobacterium griseoflavum TaxID=1474952 RepID=A0ABQ3HV58_9SPHI|nr:putative sugar nucleotidyl transferase [Sphingobacterium griseoflavum]GHE23278.1 glucose-1-phosphate thymidylyltransferase [Sphingobacterium griseoflavum]